MHWRGLDGGARSCPISTRAAKEGVHYLSPSEIARLALETDAMRVASYRYRNGAHGAGRRLGFIIDDSPDVPAVSLSYKSVDLYGFASMLLATSQAQQRRIEALEREVAHLRAASGRRTNSVMGTRDSTDDVPCSPCEADERLELVSVHRASADDVSPSFDA